MRAASIRVFCAFAQTEHAGFKFLLAQALGGIGRNRHRFNAELAETLREQGARRSLRPTNAVRASGFAGEGGEGQSRGAAAKDLSMVPGKTPLSEIHSGGKRASLQSHRGSSEGSVPKGHYLVAGVCEKGHYARKPARNQGVAECHATVCRTPHSRRNHACVSPRLRRR